MSKKKQKEKKLWEHQLPKDGSMTDKDWVELSWNYFSLLSGQRMGMVDFYIAIEVALIGALFILLTLETRITWAECTVAIAVTFISGMFFALDWRTKSMIHCCEEIIKDIEKKYYPDDERIKLPFHYIDYKTEKMCVRITYSRVFLIQYVVIGFLGLICLVLILNGKI